jgi:thiosulfate dehydrogenase [quinone] large subunit
MAMSERRAEGGPHAIHRPRLVQSALSRDRRARVRRFYLFRIGTNSEDYSSGAQAAALIVGLVLWVAAAVVLFRDFKASPVSDDVEVREPDFAQFLFSSARSAPLWLGARLFLGWQWLDTGWHKFNDDAWMDGGVAIRGYWERAVAVPEQGRPPITYGWYREYIQYMLDNNWHSWFATIIVYGEVLVGLGLIVGALVGVAAFFGALMNMSFMLAGSASTNPVLFTLSIALILAWRVAGLIGLDRWLLPALGTPWARGRFLRHGDADAGGTRTPPGRAAARI